MEVFRFVADRVGAVTIKGCQSVETPGCHGDVPDLILINMDQGQVYCPDALLLGIFRSFKPVPVVCYHASGWKGRIALKKHAGQVIDLTYAELMHGLHEILMSLKLGSELPVSTTGFRNMISSDAERILERLSPREFEVFCLLGKGHGSSEIADVLEIKRNTVDAQIRTIRNKLRIPSIYELKQLSIRFGRDGVCRVFAQSPDHMCHFRGASVGTCPFRNA